MIKLSKVKRVEVIDENGRSYVNWDKNNIVQFDMQDEGKTLKIFIAKTKQMDALPFDPDNDKKEF